MFSFTWNEHREQMEHRWKGRDERLDARKLLDATKILDTGHLTSVLSSLLLYYFIIDIYFILA